jgi:hypothetical protein
MTTYCVRLPLKHDFFPGEIVGIYSAKNRDELIDLVDECTDPIGLEFAVMPSGGIYWPGRGPIVTDLYKSDPSNEGEVLARLNSGDLWVTDKWHDSFEALKFKPLFEE